MDKFRMGAEAFAAMLSDPQGKRLLRMEFPRQDGPKATLLANTLDAVEELSRDFTYTVEVLSNDATISLKAVMGKMVTVSLVRDDGSLRYFNGYVFEFRFVRTDGGFAFYHMVLKPWLAFLRLRQDNAVFQDASIVDLCDKTFQHYLQRDVKYRLLTLERTMGSAALDRIMCEINGHPKEKIGFDKKDFDAVIGDERDDLIELFVNRISNGSKCSEQLEWILGERYVPVLKARLASLHDAACRGGDSRRNIRVGGWQGKSIY
jgi:hypothetical protein